MKLKTRKLNTQSVNLQQAADKYGEDYTILNEKVKEQAAALERQKTEIKVFAEKNGAVLGNERLVTGRHWQVGYLNAEGRSTFNSEKARKLLPKEIYAKCLSKMVDEKLVEQAVLSGEIKQSVFLAMFDESPPVKRIVVRRKS